MSDIVATPAQQSAADRMASHRSRGVNAPSTPQPRVYQPLRSAVLVSSNVIKTPTPARAAMPRRPDRYETRRV